MTWLIHDSCVDHGKYKSLRPEGYHMRLNPYGTPRVSMSHRIVYCETRGIHMDDILDLVVRHTCDNPRCINPNHLIIGTRADNNKDRATRGRSAKVVPSKVKLSLEAVEAIRARYTKGTPPKRNPNGYAAIAADYGVDPKVIFNVIKRRYVYDVVCNRPRNQQS